MRIVLPVLVLFVACVPPDADTGAPQRGDITQPDETAAETPAADGDVLAAVKLGKEDFVALSADLACVDKHYQGSADAKYAAGEAVIQAAGANRQWVEMVAQEMEAEGLMDPMREKINGLMAARCPDGVIAEGLIPAHFVPPGDAEAAPVKGDEEEVPADATPPDAPPADAPPADDPPADAPADPPADAEPAGDAAPE